MAQKKSSRSAEEAPGTCRGPVNVPRKLGPEIEGVPCCRTVERRLGDCHGVAIAIKLLFHARPEGGALCADAPGSGPVLGFRLTSNSDDRSPGGRRARSHLFVALLLSPVGNWVPLVQFPLDSSPDS
ncbi:hypothetical protein AAFF_G00009150 [Aldrovandia affinis]|uniref:Uncharacterized protein n=1 Tax=Aldrovandia affinis TaxID=143900 RepID=A0AAD7T6E4_9TELE|nr:hypothetical protein AAFF_G00009150 [Aldrovandia affinis]